MVLQLYRDVDPPEVTSTIQRPSWHLATWSVGGGGVLLQPSVPIVLGKQSQYRVLIGSILIPERVFKAIHCQLLANEQYIQPAPSKGILTNLQSLLEEQVVISSVI